MRNIFAQYFVTLELEYMDQFEQRVVVKVSTLEEAEQIAYWMNAEYDQPDDASDWHYRVDAF